MRILVTGANGFIGKNLISQLTQRKDIEIFSYDTDTPIELLEEYCRCCEVVYNLAGINRPKSIEDFMDGNCTFVNTLLETLKKVGNPCPIVNSSSMQAALDTPYGRSKKLGEEILFSYGKENKVNVYVYRFPNVFGKWCRPNYNSVIATFCYNISHGLPIQVNDRNTVMHLVYIDDVVDELFRVIEGHPSINSDGYCYVPMEYEITLGEIVDMLYSFRESRSNLMIPNMSPDSLSKKLYSTYISYLPLNSFSYPLTMNMDKRGSFTEVFKSEDRGQISVNITKPGIAKGNHWHHTKNEKFLVVSGKGVIRFRQHGDSKIIEYHVSGERLEIVDIPTGYSHAIVNEGSTDLVTLMWCNECFDPERSDTVSELV